MAGGRAATGSRAISTVPAGGRCSSVSTVPASRAAGPTPRPPNTATCSISSVTAPVQRRCARRLPRPAPSWSWSLPRTTIRGLCRRRDSAARMTPPKRRAASGGNAARSTAPTPRPISAPAACRVAGSRRSGFTPNYGTATVRPCAGFRRWSPPSPARITPAATAPSSACSAPGSIRAGPPKRRASRHPWAEPY